MLPPTSQRSPSPVLVNLTSSSPSLSPSPPPSPRRTAMVSPTVVTGHAIKASARASLLRLSTFLRRLPLLTRLVVFAIPLCYFIDLLGAPLGDKFSLDPKKMGLDQMHRLNTYPLVHNGFFHATMNLLALTPLLDRFEREVGTLKTVLLIAGPMVTFPAGLYLIIEMFVLKGHTAVVGASALVFTFLAIEAVRTTAFRPFYRIANWEIPSWTTPLIWVALASFLVPSSSLLGHLCGLAMGYAYAHRYLRLLEPSEWILTKVERWVGFVLHRLPGYIGLEKRTEMNYWEMLPMASSTAGTATGGVNVHGHAGPGRTLGA